MTGADKAIVAAIVLGLAAWPGMHSGVRAQEMADSGFDLPALQGICSDVRSRNPRFEQRILQAAGVTPEDTDAELRAKVGDLFEVHLPLCDGFNVSRGSIIKYAVAARTYDFLYDVANVWDVDLNIPDASDGRNVLDYLDVEISKNVGKPLEAELTVYRDMLVRAGARTTAQLDAGEDCRPSTRCRQ